MDLSVALRGHRAGCVATQIVKASRRVLNLPDRGGLCGWVANELDRGRDRRYPATVLAALLHAAAENPCGVPVRVLEAFAASPSRAVRLAVAQYLAGAAAEEDAGEAVRLYLRLATDASPTVREWAVFALAQILEVEPEARLRAVQEATRDAAPRVRREAREGLTAFVWDDICRPIDQSGVPAG